MRFYLWACLALLFACKNSTENTTITFVAHQAQESGIFFENRLTEGPNTNVLMYEYFYNGGGIATGDFNADGLMDLYFTSNMEENHFYLNKGEFTFQEVSQEAGVVGRPGPWKTGVTVVDINADGRLDLYLCYSGALPTEKRRNQLFVNQGNNAEGIPTFQEQATQYGLDHPGYTNQAYFFDYDHDLDLDVLLLNHNPKSLPVLNIANTKLKMAEDDTLSGLRLLQQNAQHQFIDVTKQMGINGTGLSYGLGIALADFNRDGWLDFYLSNDYAVPDYLYINQKGHFINEIEKQMGQMSQFSMGNAAADYDNNGWYDLFTLDMLPEDNERQKLLMAPDNYPSFQLNLTSGLQAQYMRNMLHRNNGNGSFTELAQWAGVSNTDWSWSPLFGDLDNDGWQDLWVTNGYTRDYTNRDFLAYMDQYIQKKTQVNRQDVLHLITQMPASNVSNYLFQNKQGQSFSNVTQSAGLYVPSNSNGACEVDLDNDGDLDLVVNNINQAAGLYENTSKPQAYLNIQLKGQAPNTMGIGTEVKVYAQGNLQIQTQVITKGYLSSQAPILHFGLGQAQAIDSLLVIWPNGQLQHLQPTINQTLVLNQIDAHKKATFLDLQPANQALKPLVGAFAHANPRGLDFNRQLLLPYQVSRLGPAMQKADLNADGHEDLVISGGYQQNHQLYWGSAKGLKLGQTLPSLPHAQASDLAFIDFDGDHDLDLLITHDAYSQSNFKGLSQSLQLFINQHGKLQENTTMIPRVMGGIVSLTVVNFDQQGPPEVLLWGGLQAGNYPYTYTHQLLRKVGSSWQVSQNPIPELKTGIVKKAVSKDFDHDGLQDLVVVGEWMSPSFFKGGRSGFRWVKDYFGKVQLDGFYHTMLVEDVNEDGEWDVLLGNTGLNTQLKAQVNEPIRLYISDFDENGTTDPIFTYFIQGKPYTLASRDELMMQIPSLKRQFSTYGKFAKADVQGIFGKEKLQKALQLQAHQLASGILMSSPTGYHFEPFTWDAQLSPIEAMLWADYNRDGKKDLFLLGNQHHWALKLGLSDANKGIMLLNLGFGKFKKMEQRALGLDIRGEIRSAQIVGNQWIFGRNGTVPLVYLHTNEKLN